MLQVSIRTRGMLDLDSISQIVFGAKGATTNHVTSARLYFTGSSTTFNSNNLLGTITTGPTSNE